MKNNIKKATLSVVMCSLLVSLFAGCDTSKKTDNSVTSENSKSPAKKTITLECGQAQKNDYPFIFNQSNFDAFEKANNIKVELVIDPDNQVKTILQTKLAAGEPSDMIVYNKVSAENELVPQKNLVDLSGEAWVSRLNNPNMLKASDGKIYGFAMQSPLDAQAMIYNKDIFSELKLEVPKSYDDFVKVCAAIKASGITPIYAPFKDAWTFQIWPAASFGSYVTKQKPNLWDDINAGKTKWADVKEFEDILQKALDLYKNGYIEKTCLTDDYNMAPNAFSQKKCAMMIMGDWFIGDMEKKDANLKLGFFPIPAFNGTELTISQGQLGGMALVPKNAKNVEQAKSFIDFISKKEQVDKAQESKAFIPSVKDAAAPKLTALQQEIYDKYVKAGKATTEMNAFMKVDLGELWKYYQDMFAGARKPKDVLAAWDKKFAELMKAAGQPGF